MYSFPYLEPVCFSRSSSNCCFLTCIQISQEAGQVVYIPMSLRVFQFIVIHTVKGSGVVNKAEIDVFLELSCFFHDPADVGNLISGSSAFSKTSLNIRKFTSRQQQIRIWTREGTLLGLENTSLVGYLKQKISRIHGLNVGTLTVWQSIEFSPVAHLFL